MLLITIYLSLFYVTLNWYLSNCEEPSVFKALKYRFEAWEPNSIQMHSQMDNEPFSPFWNECKWMKESHNKDHLNASCLMWSRVVL